MMRTCFLSLFLLFVLLSCKDNTVERYIERWQGQSVEMPAGLVYTLYGTDTLFGNRAWSEAKVKMFVYVDSTGCTSCKLRLRELMAFEDYLRNDLKCDVPVLLYFDNKRVLDVSGLLRTSLYDRPVCVDALGNLSKRYTFSKNMSHNAFLLDSLNRVVLVGYPMHNKGLEQMYIDEILKRKP